MAFLWPLVSPPEEYAEEAALWVKTIRSKLGPGRHHILELGVGGGHLLSHLTPEFQATAADISEPMLALSRRLNPQVIHHLGDMRYLRLNQVYDAVLIHDGVSYLLTEEDLSATFDTAKAHLRPGGLLIMAPDWFKDTFPGTSVMHWIRDTQQGELTCIEHVHDPAGLIKEIARVSRPGRRVYSRIKELPRVFNGLGITILSTPQGVMSDQEARAANVGGEVLCRVF